MNTSPSSPGRPMSQANEPHLLHPHSIRYVSPASVEALNHYLDEIIFLHRFVPHELTFAEFKAFLYHDGFAHTLVWVNDVLVGMFSIKPFQKSAELHGIIRTDLNSIFPEHYKPLKRYLLETVFHFIFHTLKKRKIILKAHPDNKAVKGLARMYGARKLKYPDQGRIVWIVEH